MTAPVRIDALAWGDLRFATLARLCSLADAEHALIRCAKIWAWQTEHYTPEQPTYVIDPEIVESALGPGGAGHMVRARLAEEGPDGLRIKGSEGRIEWLYQKRIASKAGGEATRRKHENKGRPSGPRAAEPEAGPAPGPKTGPLSLPPDLKNSLSKLPAGWDPDRSSAEVVEAEAFAKAKGVALVAELAKFRAWAKAETVERADWNAAWVKWLISAWPPSQRERDAKAEADRAERARANPDRFGPKPVVVAPEERAAAHAQLLEVIEGGGS